MKQYVFTDQLDTLVGMRLAGIEGELVKDQETFITHFQNLIDDQSVGIIHISSQIIQDNQAMIDDIRFNHATPLLVEILGPDEYKDAENQIAKTIQQAIGISIS